MQQTSKVRPAWSPGRRMAAGLLAALAFAGTATAQPAPRIALVVGNSVYPSLPAIPACLEAASAVAGQLRRAGFDVSERTEMSIGAMGAALNGLARRLAGAQDGSAVVYVCGYAAEFEGRPFLMPATAVLDRLSDVLAQGIAMRSVPDLVARNARRGLTVLDLVAGPGASVDSVGRFLGGLTLPPGQTVAASVAEAPAQGITPLAQALVAALQQDPDTGSAAAALRSALDRQRGQLGDPRFFLAEAPASPTPPLPQQPGVAGATAPATVNEPVVHPVVVPPVVVSPVAPSSDAPAPFPSEDRYSQQNRRQIQVALQQLGYYAGVVDGVFGAETRASIRRFQHEVAAGMTGSLTPAQADRLLVVRAR